MGHFERSFPKRIKITVSYCCFEFKRQRMVFPTNVSKTLWANRSSFSLLSEGRLATLVLDLGRDVLFLFDGVSSKTMYKASNEGGRFFSFPLLVMYLTLYVNWPFGNGLICSILAMPPGLFCPGPMRRCTFTISFTLYCDFETSGAADGRLANVAEEPLEERERSTTSVVVVLLLFVGVTIVKSMDMLYIWESVGVQCLLGISWKMGWCCGAFI